MVSTSPRLSPRTAAEGAILAALPPWREAVACSIQDRPCPDAWAALQRILTRSLVLLGLEGQARAHRQAGLRQPPATFAEVAELLPDLEPGPFLEAIEQFEGRIPNLADVVHRMIRHAQATSAEVIAAEMKGAKAAILARSALAKRWLAGQFFVTGVDKTTVIDLRDLMAEAVRGAGTEEVPGLDLVPFIDRAQLSGAASLTRARLETVWRTNLSSAFNEGQVEVLEEPAVQEVMPLLMLNEIMDRRTRGNPNGLYPDRGFHWQMNGFVGTAEDFRRYSLVPPGGYQCRAGTRGVSVTEARAEGWIDAGGSIDRVAIAAHNGLRLAIVERGDYPDPGFLR